MNNIDLQQLFDNSNDEAPPVTVIANDYRYDGWLVSVFPKKGGELRAVVQDEHGRLFMHNPSQIRKRDNG